MPKPPSPLFSCSHCGAQSTKWAGRCVDCGKWGTISEENASDAPAPRFESKPGKIETFAHIGLEQERARQSTKIEYLDRLLAGGLVSGSVTLLGGEPGIGKSTLLAQVALLMAAAGQKVLYVTGEESPSQVALRLKRLSTVLPPTLTFLDDTRADVIASTILDEPRALVIVDSVQTIRIPGVTGEPGNPTQMKASASVVSEAAKKSGTPVILVGQVTKDGDLAGPRLLEHLVDTVAMLEGERSQAFRILRVLKHRFGATDDLAVLTMNEQGLSEVKDPSASLIADRPINVPGTVVTCLAQGRRPLLVEIQGLVTSSGYAQPTRRATGIDANRLSLLLAVFARRAGVQFSEQDVFVNAVGGVDAKDPGIDLALALALVSAKNDISIPPTVAAWGEIGLLGEIRPVANMNLCVREATRLGFTTLLVPKEKQQPKAEMPGVKIIPCASVKDAIEAMGLRKTG